VHYSIELLMNSEVNVDNVTRCPRFKRQRFLLDFINQIGKEVTATEIQKLIFLHIQHHDTQLYEFIPYKYGCYSFTLDADIKLLKQEGFLVNTDSIQIHNYKPSETNYFIAKERGNSLLKRVYIEYPYYAINSEVKNKILSSQEFNKVEESKVRIQNDEETLFTIGYEGKTIEQFLNILILNNIRVLCDVRNTPFSHKFGFSKNSLSHFTKELNILYTHFPELGIEPSLRQALNDRSDYQKLFTQYAYNVNSKKESLEQIQSLIDTHQRIALMCFEHKPQDCHRHKLRDIFKNKGVVCVDL